MNSWIRFKFWWKTFFYFKTRYTVDIYLKSGAVITLTNLENFSSKRDGDRFVEFRWVSLNPTLRLVSIEPSDISAIVQRIR